ncbi:hypothetical protein CRM22_010292 [Opisthorchis felineus]|uniref:Uncharacterized protein n=2 Tax=Opisthorchis felineus TaxID=147828 RepID=A0A4V6RGP7_OPIFE|nr:hypothetical protein CRM22_010292 [Opisthorchis felineus]
MAETTTSWTKFAENSNGSHLPCINDQLALWDVTTQAYQDPRDDVDAATCLLRCYALSSRVVRNKFKGRTQATSNRKSLLPYYAIGLYEFLCSSWQHVRITLESWASPSSTLVSYAHLRNRGSPWHMGYLSSTGSPWRALCLVTTEYVELIQLITDPEHLLSDSISTYFKDEQTLLSELLDEFTENQPTDLEPPSRVNRSPLRQSTRWNLSCTDPWPRWRCVAFSPEQPTQGCSYRQVAVGYSCGSIEIIDLLALSNELNGTRQTSIVLSSPCSTQSSVTDFKSCFFPLTHIAFVDSCHLIACHFSGHVDLWHLDWEAKRFPARLMARLCLEQLCPNKRTAFPLTAADYDSQSCILVLAGLSSNPAPVTQLNQSFELHSFHVSLSPPYLAHIQSSESDSCLPATGLLSYLHRGKNALTQWMSEAIRHVHRPYPSGTDAVAFLQVNSSGRTTVIAALHCFGTCSVWSLPRLDPLFLVLGCSPLDVSPSSNASVDPSQPFRLTWWAVPSKKEDPDGLTVAVDNSDNLAQLVVLRERGELSILKFGETQIDKLVLDERQVHELNLSCYASFAYVDQASSGKIILLDQKAPTDALWKTMIFGDKTDANRRVLRAIRLSSTTPSGLYNHLIRKGCYQDAIQLALRHQQDVELVYQQQWLDLSHQVSDLCGLPTVIDSTLALIRHRPMWVLRQCLSFIPSTHANVFVSAGDFFASMRHLLKLGLERVSDLSTEHTEQMQEAVRTQLLRRLFHVECLADILLAEQANEGEPFSTDPTVNYHYPLDCLVEHLQTFRQHALLDIARFYADSERFSAVRVMMNKFPLTVGSHRLALASSLCETIHPASYVTHLLVPPSFPVEAEPPYASRGTEFEMTAVERLYSVLTFPASELTVDFRTQDSSKSYVQKLVTWLMRRARQIDTRAGLVSHSLALLELGEVVCLQFACNESTGPQDGSELNDCLVLLRRLRLEFTQLSRIVYEVSKGTRTNPTRANLSVRSLSKQIALARFGFSQFSKLSIEDRIDLLLQIKQPPQRVKMVMQKSHIAHPVLFSWGQLMVYIKQIGDGRHIRKWTTYSLVRLATYHTFDILVQLAGMIEAGTLCQLFQEIRPPLPFQHSAKRALGYQDSCGLTDMELLTCILEAVSQYEPAVTMQFDKQPADTFKIYLKDVNHLISLLFRCLASANLPADRNESAQLKCALQIFAQCASALTSLLSLSASIEKQVGHTVRLGVTSVGDFVRCAYETSRLQRFLAHWMSTILGLLYSESATKAPGPCEEAEKEQLLKKVESFVGQLRDLLHKALSGCPAEQWIPTGMQFSLLTAGNIQLFELSERLQSEYLNDQVEGKSSLHVWSVCLLHALRNYVDTCVPQASLQSGVRTRKLESLPPNEQMARHCLSLFLTFDSRAPLDRSVKKAFEMEQCLLDVSAFLSSVIEHLPSTQQSLPTAPFHLRSMWTTDSESMKQQRTTIFSIALLAMLKSLRRSHSNRRKFLELLGTDALFRIGRLFLLDMIATTDCFIRAAFKYLATTFTHVLPIEVTDHILELVIQATRMSHPSAWSMCALWAGHFSEKNKPCSLEPVNPSTGWTALHGLFRIARTKPTEPKDSIFLDDSTLVVEAFRLWLAQYALAHGPTDYLNNLYSLLAVCWYRLESLLTENGVEEQLGMLPQPLQSLCRELQTRVSDTTPRHYSAMYAKGSCSESHLEECLPYLYLPVDSSTSDIFMTILVDGQNLKHGPTIDVRERSWWRLFLHHWLFTDCRSDPVCYPSRKILSLSTSAGDFRLSLAYAALEATFVKLGGDPAVQDDILFQLSPSVRLMETQVSEYVFRPEPVSFADQSQLVTLAYAFGAWTQPDDSYRVSDCFISGEKALKNLSKPVLDVAPKAFQLVVDFLGYKAIAQRLCDRVTAILPVFDSIRFNEDEMYKQQTIQTLCATHFSIGVRLCLYSNTPLIEACNARLIHLFLEQPRWSLEVEEEITRLASCVLQFHDTSKSDLLQFCEETLYPSIQDLPALRLLFSLIATADACSNQTCLLDELPVDTHQSILTLFTSCPNCTRLAEQIGYARFIQLLKSPFSQETNGWRHHELSVYLTTEQMAGTIAKVLSLFPATIDTGLSSGDLYAMYSLNALQSESSFRQFQDRSSTLRPLLRNICLPMDVHSFERLRNWLHEFVFNKLSNQLTVEQRRWVLTETVDFLRSGTELPPETENLRPKLLEQIQLSLTQFDSVMRHLSVVPFPRKSAPEKQTEPDRPSPSGFYADFLILTPGLESQAVDLLVQLIGTVSSSDQFETDEGNIVNDKMEWFAIYLPLCLHVLQLSSCAQRSLLVKAASSMVIPYKSLSEFVLTESGMMTDGVETYRIQREQGPKQLFHYLHTSVNRITELTDGTVEPNSTFTKLLGAMMCNCAIRRLHGSALWTQILSVRSASSWDKLPPTPMFVFQASLEFLSEQPTLPCSTLRTLAHTVASIPSDLSSVTASLNEFIKSLLSGALSLTSEDTDRRRSTLLHLSDQLQTVIELFLLLIGDILDSPIPTEHGENQQRLDSQLWAYWFELCHGSGLFAESNFNLSAYLLLHQWVKYGLPPHGLAVAALDALKQSRSLPQSDSTRWSIALESNVFNICLCQRDQVLVLDTLNTLCANASVVSLINLDVCVCFVCLHGPLWPGLVKRIKDKPNLVCSPLFRHILRAIELHLSQQNCDDRGRIFSVHCMTLLHRAGLWIEAGRLARILQGSSADHTAFQTLINFVRREQLP